MSGGRRPDDCEELLDALFTAMHASLPLDMPSDRSRQAAVGRAAVPSHDEERVTQRSRRTPLADFHAAYPGITLEMSFDDGFVDIVAKGLDAGVRLGDSVAQDMVSVKVSASEPIAILGSPET